MQIQELVNTIIREAEEKALEIKKEAQQEYQHILNEAKIEAERQRELILKEEEKRIQQERTKIITQANIEKKKIILEAKNQIIDDIFKLVLEGIDKDKIPKIKKVFRDKVIEENLDKEGFIKILKERYVLELARFLNLNEKDI